MVFQFLSALMLTLLFLLTTPLAARAASPEDEAAIRDFLQIYVEPERKQDVDGMLARFASDAKIDSIVARDKVNKEQYAGAMKLAQAQGTLNRDHQARIISVAFPSSDRAILEFDYESDSKLGHRIFTLRWTLTNREGRWLIVETEYLRK